ncbi:MAG: 2-amino-4-hydroxy-6-hydroxymethyldihydropteridine diphosphokinase [Planctomycetota bacterium]|nr:MAG: 2-amino-4-hydroxy-6-hydroxymethyldihydropteridine diphosphokinase [Planctomycetota bacterium]
MPQTRRERVFIAIGSNIGPRQEIVGSAIDAIARTPGALLKGRSRIYETDPVGPIPQGPYLNAVVEIACELEPLDLLTQLLAIERAHGRDRSCEVRWGPRTLDLDILLFGDRRVNRPRLQVPHPRLAQRLFVLDPLAELAADIVPPGFGSSIAELRAALLRSAQAEASS